MVAGSRWTILDLRRTVVMSTVGSLLVPAGILWFGRPTSWRMVGENAIYSAIFANTIGLLVHGLFLAVQPFMGRVGRWGKRATVLVVLAAAATLGTFIGMGIFVLIGVLPLEYFWKYYWRSFNFSLPVTFVIGIVMGILEEIQSRLHTTTLQLRTKELERERAEKLATEARLSSLESRIHPHFLFNALNSISSLIREDPARAEQLVERMASLLRFSLDSNRAPLVPLGTELKIVADYLDIEQARFGARLRYRVDVPPEVRHLLVPPMSIQTLVENSIKYAVSTRREGGLVEVEASLVDGELRIDVRDDGPGFTAGAIPAGHGIDLLQSRLEAVFGEKAGVDILKNVVRVRLDPRVAA